MKLLRAEEIKEQSLHEHFLNDSHQSFGEDVSICLIDKTDPSDTHKGDYYWMRALKTIAPFGLNTEETYWPVCTITRFASGGIEITLGHRTWPNVFATQLVTNFPNFKLCPVNLGRKNWNLFSSFIGFKVICKQSRNNEPTRCLFTT